MEWSPDGEKIAFLPGEDLYVIDSDGGEARLLAEELSFAEDLTWSPDGKTIALTADFAVHTLTLEEPNPRLFARDANTPAWSPDGEFLAYYSEVESSTPRIVTQPAGGGDETRLEVSKKNMYSFATDLEWLGCPDG